MNNLLPYPMGYRFLSCLCFLVLAACAGEYNAGSKFKDAQFWQRVHASEAVYMRGPKAQQMLSRDIARCVTELRELIRLGVIRDALITDAAGKTMSIDEAALHNLDTPEHDRYLRMEHGDYHDFKGCMLAKGWERVLYVPYSAATESRDIYLEAMDDYGYRSRHQDNRRQDTSYIELNE